MSRLLRETLRYLGCGTTAPDAAVHTLAEQCITAVQAAATPRAQHMQFGIQRTGEVLHIGALRLHSTALARHLQGCDVAVLFAATLGAGVDALLRRTEITDMAGAVVLQAAAAAVIEEYCDSTCAAIAAELSAQGLFLRPRFSPGYGDLSLDCQQSLLDTLQSHKIGLGCTASLMLTPVKSVTAIIGAGAAKSCATGGCAICDKTDCTFRSCENTPD